MDAPTEVDHPFSSFTWEGPGPPREPFREGRMGIGGGTRGDELPRNPTGNILSSYAATAIRLIRTPDSTIGRKGPRPAESGRIPHMDLLDVLSKVELFEGLSPEDLASVARICRPRTFRAGEVITRQGEAGHELYIVCGGLVEVLRDNPEDPSAPHAVVNLGRGQIFGEMSLVDRGPRSASVRSVGDDCLVQVLDGDDFQKVCSDNLRVGYVVMRNMAADLSFKLRHRHLTGR